MEFVLKLRIRRFLKKINIGLKWIPILGSATVHYRSLPLKSLARKKDSTGIHFLASWRQKLRPAWSEEEAGWSPFFCRQFCFFMPPFCGLTHCIGKIVLLFENKVCKFDFRAHHVSPPPPLIFLKWTGFIYSIFLLALAFKRK